MIQPVENAINAFLIIFQNLPLAIRSFILLVTAFFVILLLFKILWGSR